MSVVDPPDLSKRTARIKRAILCVAIAIAITAFVQTLIDAKRFNGEDLRCKVVGARALLRGIDPYRMPPFFEHDERLLDPSRYANSFTRCTYTPTLLLIYAPLADQSYRLQRWFWVCVDWISLFGAAALLRRAVMEKAPSSVRYLGTCLFLIFFAGGYFWRLHVERGQYYSILLLLFSLGAFLCTRPKGDQIWCGIPFGIAAAIRITPLAMFLPLWLLGFRRTCVGGAIAFALVVLGANHAFGSKVWSEYRFIVDSHTKFVVDPAFEQAEKDALAPLPQTAEGLNFGKFLPDDSLNLTVDGILADLVKRGHLHIPGSKYWDICGKVAAILVVLGGCAALKFSNLQGLQAEQRLALAVTLGLLVDYATPIRVGYADVLYLLPIMLLLPTLTSHRRFLLPLALVIGGLAFGHSLLVLGGPLSTVLRTAGVMGGCILGCVLLVTTARRGEAISAVAGEHAESD